jgi:hypothetical protein
VDSRPNPDQSVREVLIAARAKIDKPQKWIKREYQKGNRYCAAGACHAVAPYPASVDAQRLLDSLTPDGIGIENFNDERTHAEVMDLFDRAIRESS